ncbi:hypothetical protein LBMAG43_17530 [Methylococcaceae bacterium]|nr:hypothetical protein LBMAG43_17530 [Methylococcaceae bacterium]
MVTTNNLQFNSLINNLIKNGFLTSSDAQKYYQEAQQKGVSLIHYLVTQKIIDSTTIASKISLEFGLPFFDLDVVDLDNLPKEKLSIELMNKHHVLPLHIRGTILYIAISDPRSFQGFDEIKFNSRLNPEPILVEEHKLAKVIKSIVAVAENTRTDFLDSDLDTLSLSNEEDRAIDTANKNNLDDVPIVRFVNKILVDAIQIGASDIHLEPYEKVFRIRYRTDGMLHQISSPSVSVANRIISLIKVMSKMDITERRVPQDGRIKMVLSDVTQLEV